METAWLIECGENPRLYYAADGDWCNNPNHAHRFPSAEEAHVKARTMTAKTWNETASRSSYVNTTFDVVEHGWD